MLANHTDVVPVEEEHWSHPPFGAALVGGRIYGRGAVDMKGCGVMQLLAVLLARRQELPLRRDLVFCALPDEEVGSDVGMAWPLRASPGTRRRRVRAERGSGRRAGRPRRGAAAFLGRRRREGDVRAAAAGQGPRRPREPAARGQRRAAPDPSACPARGLGAGPDVDGAGARLRGTAERGRIAATACARGGAAHRGRLRSGASRPLHQHAQRHADLRRREEQHDPRDRGGDPRLPPCCPARRPSSGSRPSRSASTTIGSASS